MLKYLKSMIAFILSIHRLYVMKVKLAFIPCVFSYYVEPRYPSID